MVGSALSSCIDIVDINKGLIIHTTMGLNEFLFEMFTSVS